MTTSINKYILAMRDILTRLENALSVLFITQTLLKNKSARLPYSILFNPFISQQLSLVVRDLKDPKFWDPIKEDQPLFSFVGETFFKDSPSEGERKEKMLWLEQRSKSQEACLKLEGNCLVCDSLISLFVENIELYESRIQSIISWETGKSSDEPSGNLDSDQFEFLLSDIYNYYDTLHRIFKDTAFTFDERMADLF